MPLYGAVTLSIASKGKGLAAETEMKSEPAFRYAALNEI